MELLAHCFLLYVELFSQGLKLNAFLLVFFLKYRFALKSRRVVEDLAKLAAVLLNLSGSIFESQSFCSVKVSAVKKFVPIAEMDWLLRAFISIVCLKRWTGLH